MIETWEDSYLKEILYEDYRSDYYDCTEECLRNIMAEEGSAEYDRYNDVQ